jgi:fused signal recognition particle receptor
MKLFKRKKPADTPDAVTHADAQPEIGSTPTAELEIQAAADAGSETDSGDQTLVERATEPVVSPDPQSSEQAASDRSFFDRLRNGLGRTSDNLVEGMGNLFLGRKEIDLELLEELELQLLQADVGVEATVAIIDHLTQRVSRRELTSPEGLRNALKAELLALLEPCEQPLEVKGQGPMVILMVGVNGVGKTTTIGKMAKRFQSQGLSVMLAAGDTFRAAAVEQLQVWGERNDVPVVAQHTGADSASVIFDALQAAQARSVDVLIADTAGRLHNKDNLMEELKKVVRVMAKLDPTAPHETMLVLDAGTGQNALAQASNFQEIVGVTGLSITKLDGTARGGVIFAIARKLGLPIRFVGVGEGVDDLRPFQAGEFIDALFAREDSAA